MAETYLVTGANGFLGSNLVEFLCSQQVRVRAMVRNRTKAEGLRRLGAEVIEGDLKKPQTLAAAVQGIRGVYHIAATYREGKIPDSEYVAINADGVRNMLDAAIAAGVERFIHCSTVGVLGDVKEIPATETTPFNPGDIYQRTKLQGELTALEYFRSGKMRGVVLRPAIIYGCGDTRTAKIWKMIARGNFFYVGRGEKLVHFVDVRDLARAFYLAMQKSELNGEVYIIPGPRAVPLREMVSLIARELGVKEPWLELPVKPVQLLGDLCEAVCKPLGIEPPLYRRRVDFYTKNRSFSGEKARRDLGYAPSRTFEEEIAEISRWYREHGWL